MPFDFNALVSESKRIVIPSNPEGLCVYIEELLLSVKQIHGRELYLELESGLYEVILNAIEHGNLAITKDEKQEARKSRTYDRLIADRMCNPLYKDRYVTAYCKVTPTYAFFRVEDQGEGFKWEEYENVTSCKLSFEESGRGIIMANSIFDELRYNDAGNIVSMRKIF